MIDEPFLDPDWQKMSTSFSLDLLNPDHFKRSALAIHLPLSSADGMSSLKIFGALRCRFWAAVRLLKLHYSIPKTTSSRQQLVPRNASERQWVFEV
jgi:hypothetical protein